MKKSIISVLAATAAATAIAGGPLPKIEDLDRYMTIKEPDESGFVWYKPEVENSSPARLNSSHSIGISNPLILYPPRSQFSKYFNRLPAIWANVGALATSASLMP